MAVDVIQKAISANDIKNGTIVVKTGLESWGYQNHGLSASVFISEDRLYNWLDTKFDDPTYYTCAT